MTERTSSETATSSEETPARFTHRIPIRYGECDQQGIVFNAHYLAYVDDSMDHWMRSLPTSGDGPPPWVGTWDVMLKRATLDWHGPARWTEVLSIECAVSRWGRTSFDAVFRVRVAERPVADALITYVSVDPVTHAPMPTPPSVVDAMGTPVTVPDGPAVGG